MTWDPTQYARFGEDRLRPFVDLLARVRPSASLGSSSTSAAVTARRP